MEQYAKEKKLKMSEDDAKGLVDVLKERARSLDEVKEVVDQWTQDAKERAKNTLKEVEGDLTDEEREKRLEAAETIELRKIERDIDNLLKRHLRNQRKRSKSCQIFPHLRKY